VAGKAARYLLILLTYLEVNMKLLKNHEIEEEIIKIIKEAKNSVVIVSPYINFYQKDVKWENLFNSLLERSKEGLFIEVHVRKNQDNRKPYIKKEGVIKKFKDITLGNIYLHMNLHAKLYFNEEKVLVTSMNILQSSLNNIEIGYLLEKEDVAEQKELFSDFYYPELINTYPELKNNDDSIIIKNRKSFLVGNLGKLIEDIEISTDDNCSILKVSNKNYEIEVKIQEEQNCSEPSEELLSDVVYNLYFYITIKNENYEIKNLEETIRQRSDELLVLDVKSNHISILFHLGSYSRLCSKDLLTDNFWFGNANRGLFHLIKMLEENKQK
jgi:hypothetical protein